MAPNTQTAFGTIIRATKKAPTVAKIFPAAFLLCFLKKLIDPRFKIDQR
jgi:hypothetical protein